MTLSILPARHNRRIRPYLFCLERARATHQAAFGRSASPALRTGLEVIR
ncbi:hypothetical protein [Allosalinactinospora lopnorensis]|nr:hypothetical protein [Allosalinactinospora lopnorensis]